MKESTLARPRPPRAPTPGQLTLEDWAEILKVGSRAPETPRREATNVGAHASVGAVEKYQQAPGTPAETATEAAARHHPVATVLLKTPAALLTRTHLRQLGLERRAVDAVFRALPVVALPGYSRPMIRVEEYLELIDEHTYRDDRVRPLASSAHG